MNFTTLVNKTFVKNTSLWAQHLGLKPGVQFQYNHTIGNKWFYWELVKLYINSLRRGELTSPCPPWHPCARSSGRWSSVWPSPASPEASWLPLRFPAWRLLADFLTKKMFWATEALLQDAIYGSTLRELTKSGGINAYKNLLCTAMQVKKWI